LVFQSRILKSVLKRSKPSPAESEFLFEIDPEPAAERLTSYGGAAVLIATLRSLGVAQSVARHIHIKKRDRGYDEATFVESFVVLNGVGGDCLDDFDQLRADAGLASMLGHDLPSPGAARNFLYEFHDESRIHDARQQCTLLGMKAYIPGENAALSGLGLVNREVVQEVGRRCPEQRIATVDQDATIIESRKQEALRGYEGERCYQPMLAVWAEMNLVLADEFRDGNVPAAYQGLPVAKAAFASLPSTVHEYYFRGDSACHEHELIDWLRDEKRRDGPQGFIGFGVSARMSPALRHAVEAVPEAQWEVYGKHDAEVTRECADVSFVPNEHSEHKDTQPLRYVAIRIRPRQGGLLNDGTQVKHFAVVSNIREWKPARLLQWHREKAGTIEAVHDVLKNELSAGVLPCGRFGANAAWLRLAVLTYNTLTALKRLALPAELLQARPKRLRFLFFNTAGRFVQHARKTILRLAMSVTRLAELRSALTLLPVRV
jgi:hypothetical protein